VYTGNSSVVIKDCNNSWWQILWLKLWIMGFVVKMKKIVKFFFKYEKKGKFFFEGLNITAALFNDYLCV
jgi:hypothetical protein